MMFMARFAKSHFFGHSARGMWVYNMNLALRRRLHAWMPGIFWPSVGAMVREDVRASEVKRRGEVTTRRIVVSAGVIGMGLVWLGRRIKGVREGE